MKNKEKHGAGAFLLRNFFYSTFRHFDSDRPGGSLYQCSFSYKAKF